MMPQSDGLIAARIKERQEAVRREFRGYRLARASRPRATAWPGVLRRLFAGKAPCDRGHATDHGTTTVG